MLIIIITSILVFLTYVFVIMVHEFSHYLGFRFFGYKKVKLSFSFTGDVEIGFNLHKQIKLFPTLMITLSGIFGGLIPVFLLGQFMTVPLKTSIYILYILLCMGDINLIMAVLNQKTWDMTLYDMNVNLWKEYEEKIK